MLTRGYYVMRGYYKMEDRTAEVIDEERWLHTGDLAVMDEDGYVRITGRAKDMIIHGVRIASTRARSKGSSTPPRNLRRPGLRRPRRKIR